MNNYYVKIEPDVPKVIPGQQPVVYAPISTELKHGVVKSSVDLHPNTAVLRREDGSIKLPDALLDDEPITLQQLRSSLSTEGIKKVAIAVGEDYPSVIITSDSVKHMLMPRYTRFYARDFAVQLTEDVSIDLLSPVVNTVTIIAIDTTEALQFVTYSYDEALNIDWSNKYYVCSVRLPYVGSTLKQSVDISVPYYMDGRLFGGGYEGIKSAKILPYTRDIRLSSQSKSITFPSSTEIYTKNKRHILSNDVSIPFNIDSTATLIFYSQSEGRLFSISPTSLTVSDYYKDDIYYVCSIRWTGQTKNSIFTDLSVPYRVDGDMYNAPEGFKKFEVLLGDDFISIDINLKTVTFPANTRLVTRGKYVEFSTPKIANFNPDSSITILFYDVDNDEFTYVDYYRVDNAAFYNKNMYYVCSLRYKNIDGMLAVCDIGLPYYVNGKIQRPVDLTSSELSSIRTIISLLGEDSDNVINKINEVLKAFENLSEDFSLVTQFNDLNKFRRLSVVPGSDYISFSTINNNCIIPSGTVFMCGDFRLSVADNIVVPLNDRAQTTSENHIVYNKLTSSFECFVYYHALDKSNYYYVCSFRHLYAYGNYKNASDLGTPYYVDGVLYGGPDFDSEEISHDKSKQFTSLFANSNDAECFLFFTDPHLCQHADDSWKFEFENYMRFLKKQYDDVPISLVFCGGDWLGGGISFQDATYRLGLVNSICRRYFDKIYFIRGNHESNLDYSSNNELIGTNGIRNLLFKEQNKIYYKVDVASTSYYIFDTQSEVNQDLAYSSEQLLWFANSLMNNSSNNLVLMSHMFYNPYDNETVDQLMVDVLRIAQAFNNRSSVSVGTNTFDFSSCDGYIKYVMCGHSHLDKVSIVNDIPVVLTTHMRDGGVPTFDLCLADYDSNKLKLIRVGSGSDRTINMYER